MSGLSCIFFSTQTYSSRAHGSQYQKHVLQGSLFLEYIIIVLKLGCCRVSVKSPAHGQACTRGIYKVLISVIV
jgi:hypothetical protein